MIEKIIDWSIYNRILILMISVMLTIGGIVSIKSTPIDAIPDLSDVQVIIKTSFPGQAPQVVEDQVTYPLTTAMLAVPGAKTVRGYSFFGDSYVYIIFEDGTDLYWARSRVLEYLNQVSASLPAEAKTQLGPDASGVGWVYEYAIVDTLTGKSGQMDLAELRSIQDWFLKFELQSVPGVSEVATVGGFVKQYQVVINPYKLRAYSLAMEEVIKAIRSANSEIGGSVIELAEAEYMVRSKGYISNISDLQEVLIRVNNTGTPILLRDIADIRLGPQMRRGIAELDGEGEVVGGIVVMRSGENALEVIEAVKKKLQSLRQGLPKGVEIVETYDRSTLIYNAVENLEHKLMEEFIVVALVCLIFLFHIRSVFVVIISLPIGILSAFMVMNAQGITANIMSLGGIAIAIGAMVDASIVMMENVHKHFERENEQGGINSTNRWQIIAIASKEVGPALFFSLLIITVSFVPVFALEAQEGKLFAPLAYTKTYAMAAAAILSITLVPVLMGYFIRGHIIKECNNPVNRLLIAVYKPFIELVLKLPKTMIAFSIIVTLSALWPMMGWTPLKHKIGSEFMPDLDEGDLMYMPTTFPGLSIGKAKELLQQTNKLIMTVPEVRQAFGKIGRAETATDPAPLTMIETLIRLKPKEQWREGMDLAQLKKELNKVVKIPSLSNAWVMPIKTRIDMLSTGIKTPIGIKISGVDLGEIERIGSQIEKILIDVPGTSSVFADKSNNGRYITVDIKRQKAARLGLTIKNIQTVVGSAIGGLNISESVEGLERYPINIRYPQVNRNSVAAIKLLPVIAKNGAQVPLGDVADIRYESGPPMIKSENARLNGWVFVDISDRDIGSYVKEAKQFLQDNLDLPAGYSIAWSGQFEYLLRAQEKMLVVVPLALMIIIVLLYLNFKNFADVLMILGALPMALVGGVWLLYWLDFNFSVAVWIGFIALAGVGAETGVIMLVYLKNAWEERLRYAKDNAKKVTHDELTAAIIEGALLRIRPKVMTVTAIIAGLLPIMLTTGTGSEVMQRIAAPMVGGMISAMLLTLLVIPAIFSIYHGHRLKNE
ncbi:MAG: efflux RND transporter permease subunit [gamma proteobacterium symbiont of Taylorina sp.]|nr:efflux RND transporter permease subunit [gamma proteobacterium symbiont of Taylorina sp.]